MWRFKSAIEDPVASFEELSKVCDLAISAEGALDVVLHGPTLTFESLQLVIDRIEASGVDAHLQRVAFDLGEIVEIRTPWTAVLALLIRFARRVPLTCRARNLSGQPANIFALYWRSSELMRLLAVVANNRLPALRRVG